MHIMPKRGDPARIVSCSLCLSAILVGLGLFLTVTTTGAQTQKSVIDLNTASEKELESLKGVGPATAKKIIAGRPYSSIGDLSKAGVPAKTIEGMKPYVTVGTPAAASRAAAQEVQSKASASPAPSTAPSPSTVTRQKAPVTAAAKLAPGQKVNINTATAEQLEALPGIGPVKAQAIIGGRPYEKTEDIMKVKGIKQGIFDKLKDVITVR